MTFEDTCPVEESHSFYQRDLATNESRDTQLRKQMPLSEFEGQAVALLLADGYINHPIDAVSCSAAQEASDRITLHAVRPDLMPRAYATDGLTRDRALLGRFTTIVIEQICQRLQDEYVSDPRNQA